MKKFLSIILCVIVLAVTLTGCGNGSIAGTYSFRMGKLESQHMAIYMVLTDNVVKEEEKEIGKKFTLTMDLGSMMGMEGASQELIELSSKVKNISIEGTYKQENSIIKLRVDLKETIGKYFPEISQEELDKIPDIPPEFIEKLIYSYIEDETINLLIPVSFYDLIFQLYWYGYDLYDPKAEIDKHPVATHPTATDIEKINIELKYPENHKDSNDNEITYRDYHTLKLGLTKES